MVVSGLPDPRADHAEAIAEMALAMRAEIERRVDPNGDPLTVLLARYITPEAAVWTVVAGLAQVLVWALVWAWMRRQEGR